MIDSGLSEFDYQNKHSNRQIFTTLEEQQLAEYAVAACKLHFGLSTKKLRRLAYQFAVSLDKPIHDSWSLHSMASEDWYLGFMSRNQQLSLRKPENTSIARIKAVNKENVLMFFDNYRKVSFDHNISSDRIYNFDETGVNTVMDSPKVIAPRGMKQVGQATSAERGSQITLGVFINTLENALPTVYVLPASMEKARKNSVLDSNGKLLGAPDHSLVCFSDSECMTAECFRLVLQHLHRYANPSASNPVLLLMDNHTSHCALENIKYAKENHIHLLTFPPHLTARMQPLNVGVYGPFKTAMKYALQDAIDMRGKALGLHNLPEIIQEPL